LKLLTGDKNSFFEKHHSNESKEKIKQKLSGRRLTKETKEKIGKANYICKYCGMYNTHGNHDRWHNENCKSKWSAK
jgi:hypothetical protein